MTRFVVLAVLLVACSDPVSSPAGGAGHEAHELVAAGATLVDVRTESEWAGGHLEGAVLIPIDELESRMSEIPRDQPVVVYCAAGSRSARAAALLEDAGYRVHDLGGMSNWGSR